MVDKKWFVHRQRIEMTEPLWNLTVAIHQKEVSSTNNRFSIDDIEHSLASPSLFKMNNPHACVFILFIRFAYIPVYQRTKMKLSMIEKREKHMNSGNDHAQKSIFTCIQFNKDGVISSLTTKAQCCSDSFKVEPSSSTKITRCIECSDWSPVKH